MSYLHDRIRILTRGGFRYAGEVFRENETHLWILDDKTGHPVAVRIDDLVLIEMLSGGDL